MNDFLRCITIKSKRALSGKELLAQVVDVESVNCRYLLDTYIHTHARTRARAYITTTVVHVEAVKEVNMDM